MIILDTSALIDALSGPRRSGPMMRDAIAAGQRLVLPTLVLYEWLRGPRMSAELGAQEALFPAEEALAFGAAEAAEATRLYGAVDRPRGREVDIAIAAHASLLGAAVWTLNTRDFDDLAGVELYGGELGGREPGG